MKKLLTFLISLIPALAFADSTVVGNLRGLNNADSSIMIGDSEAQDLSNVDITDNGFGIKKRDGYSQFKTVVSSTWGVRGGYYFRDTTSTDCIIHTNNRTVYVSKNGGNYTSIVTTDTAGSYYDFTDSNGYLWRANSNNDEIFRYSGSVVTYYPSHPKGNQIEALPDRLVISGVTANPNRVYFSAAADFTDFTTGILETSPFTEDIGMPGQNVTALKYAFGRLLIWTRDTMVMWTGSSQFDGVIEDISATVGTSQPNSIIYDQGIVSFQGNDGHFYQYDGNTLQKISDKITGSVDDFAKGSVKSWSQTTQTDFESGTLTGDLSATLDVGSVVPSTWTDTDTSDIDFSAGAHTNTTTTTLSGSVYLDPRNSYSTFDNFTDGNYTSNPVWVSTGSAAPTVTSGILNLFDPVSALNVQLYTTASTAAFGTWQVWLSTNDATGSGQATLLFTPISSGFSGILAVNGYQVLVAPSFVGLRRLNSSGWTTLFSSATTAITATNSTMTFTRDYAGNMTVSINGTLYGSATDITYTSSTMMQISNGGGGDGYFIDNILTPDVSISGNFISQSLNTSLSSAAWLSSSANHTTNNGTVSYETRSSSDSSTWSSWATLSTGSASVSPWNKYIQYKVSFTGDTVTPKYPYFSDITLSARQSTGTFISQVKEVGTSISSWGNFTADSSGDGTIAYFVRTATSSAMLDSASWVSVTDNSQITASTNPFVQVKATFTITAATQVPTLENFTIFWNEGTLTRTYGISDKNHRLFWSLAENGSTANNATYIYDMRFTAWLKYSAAIDSPAKVGDYIYFGDTSIGDVYIYPSGSTDDGTAITAYWKSKDFLGSDPFSEKIWKSYSVLAKTDAGSNFDLTYSTNMATGSLRNYSLTDSASATIKRINTLFPTGTVSSFLNLKFSNDDSDAPFEIYSFRLDYDQRPWRVMP